MNISPWYIINMPNANQGPQIWFQKPDYNGHSHCTYYKLTKNFHCGGSKTTKIGTVHGEWTLGKKASGKHKSAYTELRIKLGLPQTDPEGRYKKGGKIPKAGLYKLHKGEVVVPAHRVKTVDKALKKSGRKPLKKVCKNCVLTKNRKVSKK